MTSQTLIEWAKEMGIELLFRLESLIKMQLLKGSTEASGMKLSMPICLIQSQRLKRLLMFG